MGVYLRLCLFISEQWKSYLVLDIETGKKIHLLHNSTNKNQISSGGRFFDPIDLDEENGNLIQLYNQKLYRGRPDQQRI